MSREQVTQTRDPVTGRFVKSKKMFFRMSSVVASINWTA